MRIILMLMLMLMLMLIVVVGIVSGCGDDTNTSTPNVTSVTPSAPIQLQTYTISGKVRNLRSGAMLTLQNNGGDKVVISEKSKDFNFPVKVATGESYRVEMLTQLGQICAVKNGVGTVSAADVIDIVVECAKFDDELLANQRKEFTSILQLNKVLAIPEDGRIKDSVGVDSTAECATKIESKKELKVLNEKLKLDNFSDWPKSIVNSKNLPERVEQKAIFISLAELKKCKKSGDEWRNKNYYPEVVSVVNKGYAEMFALIVNLYAKKMNYVDFVKQNFAIRKKFKSNVNQAIQQTAEKQRLNVLAQQEPEKQMVEKTGLEALAQPIIEVERKKVIEEQRLAELAVQQEEQMVQAEELRVKEMAVQKQKIIEQEKEFQSLHQRQKFERLK
jgi:hypothetical protein